MSTTPPAGGAPGTPLPHADGAEPDERAGRPGPSRARRVAWGVGAAALACVVVVNVVEHRAAVAEDARLAQVDGIVPSLAEPVTEVWRHPGWYPVTVTDGVVVAEGDGSALEGLDSRTGEVVWRVERPTGGHGWCSPAGTEAFAFREIPPAERLICTVTTDAFPGAQHRIEVVDPRTGEVLGGTELTGTLVSTSPVGETDLLVAVVDGSRRLVLARIDGLTGARVWQVTGPALPEDVDQNSLSVWEHGGVVVAEVPGWTLPGGDMDDDALPLFSVSTETGEPADATTDGPSGQVWFERSLRDGRTMRVASSDEGVMTTQLEDAAGQVVLEREGWPWMPGMDDGSLDDTLLLYRSDGDLELVDLRSGETRWTITKAPDASPALAVGGRLLVFEHNWARALDLDTGEVIWELQGVTGYSAVTDGRRVLFVRSDAEGGLSAHDLRDGTELWRTEQPGVQRLLAVPGATIALTESALVALG
nr:PQQ-binding-like beta-propeller repeat protein [Cellulomonas sp. APG4]